MEILDGVFLCVSTSKRPCKSRGGGGWVVDVCCVRVFSCCACAFSLCLIFCWGIIKLPHGTNSNYANSTPTNFAIALYNMKCSRNQRHGTHLHTNTNARQTQHTKKSKLHIVISVVWRPLLLLSVYTYSRMSKNTERDKHNAITRPHTHTEISFAKYTAYINSLAQKFVRCEIHAHSIRNWHGEIHIRVPEWRRRRRKKKCCWRNSPKQKHCCSACN